MKKAFAAFVMVMLLLSLVALPALGEEIEYSPSGTPITYMKPSGSGTNSTPSSGEDWIEMGWAGRAEDGSIQILVNGKFVLGDVRPFIDGSDRVQAPFRVIGEALGCTVEWNEADKKVTCLKEGVTVEMFIGNDTFWVNGKPQVMDTVPQINEDRTFIPIRALGEALNCEVAWNHQALYVIVRSARV